MTLSPEKNPMMDGFNFIRSFIDKNGYSPSHAAIQKALGLKSKSGVSRIVDSLEQRNLISRSKNRTRSLQLVTPAEKPFSMVISLEDSHGLDSAINYLLQDVSYLKTPLISYKNKLKSITIELQDSHIRCNFGDQPNQKVTSK